MSCLTRNLITVAATKTSTQQHGEKETIHAQVGKPFNVRLHAPMFGYGMQWYPVFNENEFVSIGCDNFPQRKENGESGGTAQILWFSPRAEGTFQITIEHRGSNREPTEAKTYEVTVTE